MENVLRFRFMLFLYITQLSFNFFLPYWYKDVVVEIESYANSFIAKLFLKQLAAIV